MQLSMGRSTQASKLGLNMGIDDRRRYPMCITRVKEINYASASDWYSIEINPVIHVRANSFALLFKTFIFKVLCSVKMKI